MLWSLFFRSQYRLLRLLDPVIRILWRRGLWGDRIVGLTVRGRASGRPRFVLLTLLIVGEAWYVGHPDGAAAWTRNLAAASTGRLTVPSRPAAPILVRAEPVPRGRLAEPLVRATWAQQPFPANLLYSLARRHVRAAGVFFRLDPEG